MDSFTYLGTKISKDGNSLTEIEERLKKERRTFGSLNNIWKSSKIAVKTKIRFFKSNVLSVLLYGSETWKDTESISKKLDVFQNKCLRRILKIFWPNKISNQNLLQKTGLDPISQTVLKRRWRWLGHIYRMEDSALPKVALKWTPQGCRKRGRPMQTWRRTVDREVTERGLTWGQIKKLAADRDGWRSRVNLMCPRHNEDK